MMARVHFYPKPNDLELLTSKLSPELTLTFDDDIPDDGVEIVVSGRPEPEMIQHPATKALIIPWAGIPLKALTLVRENPHVSLHNIHHNAVQVAELAVGLLFAAAKFIVPYDSKLRKGNWSPRYQNTESLLLNGKTAVILGYGNIGIHAAKILSGIGMRVVGINRSGNSANTEHVDAIASIKSLNTWLPQANILLIALPLTDETKGLIGETEIRLLPNQALMVNIGRGPIIDQHALYNNLKNGHLAGAGLDVWWNYPTDEDSRSNTFPSDVPLQDLRNVVMSPHRAGAVIERSEGWTDAIADLLNTYVESGHIPNRVDITMGY